MMFHRLARATAFAAILACAQSVGAADDVLRIGMTTEPNSLSPLLALNDYETFVDRFVFDVLITIAPDGRTFIPRLAAVVPTLENGGVSRDGLTLTYHLRRNVSWQDGAPFTSADVRFSYDAIMNPANNVPNRQGFDVVRNVTTPDAYTVVFHMKRPYAAALSTLFSDETPGAIIPRHLLAHYADLNRIAFNEQPIGTGPYKVLRWDRGQSVELVANDHYYLGRPKIPRISVRFIPDETTLTNQLRTHELDLFTQASVNAYGQLRTVPGIRIALVNIHGASNLLINMTKPELQDVRVRRAIAYAIDKRAIVDRFTFGAAKVATEDLPDFMWAYDPHVRTYDYDPPRARALLREARWIPGPDGIVAKNGRPLQLTFAYAQNNATARLISVQIQSYLHDIGIDAELKGYNSAMMFAAKNMGGIYQSGNFDLAWYTMTLGIDPQSAGRFSCAAIPPVAQNYSRYCNPAMDAAQRDGLTHFDRPTRKRAYAKSQELLAQDVPIVFVFWPLDIEASTPRLYNFTPNADVPNWNANEWSF